MSAALQLSLIWGAASTQPAWPVRNEAAKVCRTLPEEAEAIRPSISMAFYRKHTESLLRRYLYASMHVGRAPSVLGDPVGRGWSSSRKLRTFEDTLVFVLDVERCLNKLPRLDRLILNRVVLQEYPQGDVATMFGVSIRTINSKVHQALDRMTEILLNADLLDLPH